MAEIIKVVQNFNWDTTKRKLAVFMPCYGNKELVEYSVKHIKTAVEPWNFCIIIGNDGKHIDWSYLNTEDMPNVYYFTLLHDAEQPRNGAFIRNYAIKRCESDFFFQKDGEVVIEGDFLLHADRACSRGSMWRPGNVYVLSKEGSIMYMEQQSMEGVEFTIQKRIEPVRPINPIFTKRHIIAMNGQVNFTSFFHYAYCVKTQHLKNIHGYDEDYKFYGYEDSDMFCRLVQSDMIFEIDYENYAIHLWHPSTVNKQHLMPMGQLFESKNPLVPLRNPGIWGEGI